MRRLRVTLRPIGKGNWRPMVVDVHSLPREQGRLFRKDDSELDLVKRQDEWKVGDRKMRVVKIEEIE